jgi:ABC-2 type transport system ATP-binding protein
MSAVISANNLNKKYGNFIGIDNVSFDIMPGSIVGLIGPNGAGKTSILKAILGLANFEGDLKVLGCNPHTQRNKIMHDVAYVADVAVLPRWLKVINAVDYVAGVHPKFDRKKAEQLLAKTQIPLSKKVKGLSKGMVAQLHLVLIMSIDAKVLVLDEPTLGLDILYRKAFYDHLLNDFFDESKTIVITTHQIEEIEHLLTHVLFIKKGQMVLDTSIDQISQNYYEVMLNEAQLEQARHYKPINERQVFGRYVLMFKGVAKAELEQLGEVRVPSLSDLFVAKMGDQYHG